MIEDGMEDRKELEPRPQPDNVMCLNVGLEEPQVNLREEMLGCTKLVQG